MSIDRKSPRTWDDFRNESWKHRRVPLQQYVKYCRWYRSEFTETGDLAARSPRLPKDWRGTLANMTNLVTRVMLSELFFHLPRFVVRPTGSLNGMFTPQLAKVESQLLNIVARDINLYRQARRALLDGLLGPEMILKVGYTGRLVIDQELITKQREVADEENQLLFTVGRNPRAKADDLHSVHIEQHEQALALAERGVQPLPQKKLEYLKKHIEMHKKELPGERPTETVRNDSVFCVRQSPLNYFYDPWADDPLDREWVGSRYIRRIEDIQAEAKDNDYSPAAVAALHPIQSKWLKEQHLPWMVTETTDTPDQYTMLYEILDLTTGNLILYADGGKVPLTVKPWGLLSILPSGPYIDNSFIVDPFEGYGVAPPAIYEAHQIAATYLAAVNTKTVMRSSPKLGYNAQYIHKDEIANLKKFEIAGIFPFENLQPGMKVSDLMFQIPPAAIPDQNLAMEALHRRMIEQLAGPGSAKLSGGDFAKTATASAIIGESTTNLSEDMSSVVDNWMGDVGDRLLRIVRLLYTKARVGEMVGQDGLRYWPWMWAERDIVNSRGVSVVSGSSRRNNSAVEQKLLSEVYGMVAPDPEFPATFKMELMSRLLDGMGLQGFDLDGLTENAIKQRLMQQMMAQMQAAPPQAPPSGAKPRPRESSEPSQAGMMQGLANVGGGRVATGASVGDNVRMMREGAKVRALRGS